MSKEIIPSPGGSNKFSRLISKIKAALGIVENGNTASHTIASGKFVTWKGDLYKAKSAIPSGTTLSSTNLQAVSEGGLNELSEQIGNLIKVVVLNIWSNETINAGSQKYKWVSIASACPSGYKPIAITLESANIKCVANINDGASTQPYFNEATVCVHNLDSNNAQSLDVNMIITCLKN